MLRKERSNLLGVTVIHSENRVSIRSWCHRSTGQSGNIPQLCCLLPSSHDKMVMGFNYYCSFDNVLTKAADDEHK